MKEAREVKVVTPRVEVAVCAMRNSTSKEQMPYQKVAIEVLEGCQESKCVILGSMLSSI